MKRFVQILVILTLSEHICAWLKIKRYPEDIVTVQEEALIIPFQTNLTTTLRLYFYPHRRFQIYGFKHCTCWFNEMPLRFLSFYDLDYDDQGFIRLYNATNLFDAGEYDIQVYYPAIYYPALDIVMEFYITVIDPTPSCMLSNGTASFLDSSRQRHLALECRFTYRGNSTPTLEWAEDFSGNRSIRWMPCTGNGEIVACRIKPVGIAHANGIPSLKQVIASSHIDGCTFICFWLRNSSNFERAYTIRLVRSSALNLGQLIYSLIPYSTTATTATVNEGYSCSTSVASSTKEPNSTECTENCTSTAITTATIALAILVALFGAVTVVLCGLNSRFQQERDFYKKRVKISLSPNDAPDAQCARAAVAFEASTSVQPLEVLIQERSNLRTTSLEECLSTENKEDFGSSVTYANSPIQNIAAPKVPTTKMASKTSHNQDPKFSTVAIGASQVEVVDQPSSTSHFTSGDNVATLAESEAVYSEDAAESRRLPSIRSGPTTSEYMSLMGREPAQPHIYEALQRGTMLQCPEPCTTYANLSLVAPSTLDQRDERQYDNVPK